ncbi:hypothetical protein AXK56_09225 [Tsukamurella pulmonis]|uniref:Uncharacterized protein n=2 Tax=Tsukamurella pulmonis TaxID=47312 RepID=A0A1H1BM43_9ACTN|nr:hypothetical protein AXK56_09225 [Tsukamurella pulmonis]SDQ53095.1 hypothetical protein SAMN04489765_0765 [Tsukamurella pulmonis]SUP24889.1 Uncharacterised protein [Tsukamurella pulmonis]
MHDRFWSAHEESYVRQADRLAWAEDMPTATAAQKRKRTAAIDRETADDGADTLAGFLESLAMGFRVIQESGPEFEAPISGALPASISPERARGLAQQMEDVTLPRLMEIMALLRGRAAE